MPFSENRLTLPSGLGLEFFYRGDRWQHRIVIDEEGRKAVVLESDEGDHRHAWPPSPPLQELDRLGVDSESAILGVGRAGSSHWSASFSIEIEMASPAIFADIACVSKKSSPKLPIAEAKFHSTYLLAPEVAVIESDGKTARLKLDKRIIKVAGVDCQSHQTTCGFSTDRMVISTEFRDELAANTRWSYRVQIEGTG